MSIEYLFPNSKCAHYDAFRDSLPYIEGLDKDIIESIDKDLLKFNGKVISVKGWQDSVGVVGVIGIEFESKEDLLYFKLRFN